MRLANHNATHQPRCFAWPEKTLNIWIWPLPELTLARLNVSTHNRDSLESFTRSDIPEKPSFFSFIRPSRWITINLWNGLLQWWSCCSSWAWSLLWRKRYLIQPPPWIHDDLSAHLEPKCRHRTLSENFSENRCREHALPTCSVLIFF